MSVADVPWRNDRRILILIPHPDDEAVGCCAAVERAQKAGAQVFGLMLTAGVPAREIMWPWRRVEHSARVRRRRVEAETAVRERGFVEVLYRELPSRQLRSNLAQARRDVAALIARWGINALWAPAYEGGHADHDAANVLAHAMQNCVSEIFEFAEYNYAGGRIRSQQFPQPNGSELVLTLSPEEKRRKDLALKTYASAKRDLNYVRVECECLRPLATYDYNRPPHEGTLFYQRFHWVPFRHPDIDFTHPDQACADFRRFLDAVRSSAES
jgi:LmbE family N-acetylglucosaminyl deacetylase